MKKGIFVLLFVALIFGCSFASALNITVGNAKMVLYPKVSGIFGTTISKSIFVNNTNDVPVNVTLTPDENFSKIVNVIDKAFTLQPGESKDAQFTIKLKKPGKYRGQIYVSFVPAAGKGAGVGFASSIKIFASGKGSSQDNGNDNSNSDTNKTTTGNNANTDSGITGNVIGKNGINPLYILLPVSTLILLGLLLLLMFRIKRRKINNKRSDRGS
jgi:hypothetical protein